MTIVKTETIQAQATTLGGCCQSDNMSTDCGSSMEDLDESVKLTASTEIIDKTSDNDKYHFPKRDPVDVEFKDLRFTASRFSLKKLKCGKCFKFKLYSGHIQDTNNNHRPA